MDIVGPGGPAEAIASIAQMMAQANQITRFPTSITQTEEGQPPQDTPVRSYCVSKLRAQWVSKASPLSSILREYLGALEATKRFSKEELLSNQLNLLRNTVRLNEKTNEVYRAFIDEIVSFDESIYRAPVGASNGATKATTE